MLAKVGDCLKPLSIIMPRPNKTGFEGLVLNRARSLPVDLDWTRRRPLASLAQRAKRRTEG